MLREVVVVSISMHACDLVPIVVGLLLAALRTAGAPLISIENDGIPLRWLLCVAKN